MTFYRQCFTLVLAIGCCSSVWAQNNTTATLAPKPKLVVGIVIDQMRWDFLYRYSDKYGTGGFKRLLREGYSCQNTHINYSPSYTACGHTCVYSGSVPSIHGITGNSWHDLNEGKVVNCVEDTTRHTIGSASNIGEASPQRMLATTVTDELRLSNNFQSKVISVALKDRSAILPGGHTANGAYYFDGSTGSFISSSFYMDTLPNWVQSFNSRKPAENYVKQNWNTLLPVAQYYESHEDDKPFERSFENETRPVFQHNVSALMNPSPEIIVATPYGNSLTLDFAKSAIAGENLGKGNQTDFLAISLSSTDIIGHQFGPNSVEIEDCYLRLDKDLAAFFTYLDQSIGKGNYVVFITADHGAAHSVGYMQEKKIPAGIFTYDTIFKQLENRLDSLYPTQGKTRWLLDYRNMQLYLNNNLLQQKLDSHQLTRTAFVKTVRDFILQFPGVENVLDLSNLANENVEAGLKQAISNGIYPKRSGDLFILHQPGWMEGFTKGTTHGTVYAYDTHIPLVFMGWKVKPGEEDFSDIHMTDIAPTIAAMLHIQEPSGNVGKVIKGVWK